MGLASKLAAAQSGAPPAGGSSAGYPPTQGPPSGQKPGAYPGQSQYQAYPGSSSSSQPPPQQSGSSYPSAGYSPAPYPSQQAPASYSQQNSGYNRPPPPPPQGGYGYQSQQGQQGQQYQQFGSQPPYSQGPPSSFGNQGQYPPQGQQQQNYPPQGQQQNYQQQNQYPPQGQQGYPPQGQQHQYGQQQGGYSGGAPQSQPAGPAQIAGYKQTLQQAIQEKRLQAFYPPGSPVLDQIANRAATQVDRLCQAWRVPKEIGNDIVRLALYDIVIYIDDSGSMQFEEKGERIKDLQLILQRVAFAGTLFDDDGVDVRFMNQDPPPSATSGLRTEQQVEQLLSGHRFSGLTPMGTNLRKKVIDGMFLPALRSGSMKKPLLVIAITDGQPAGEPQTAVFDTVREAVNEASRSRYGPGAIAFQFAQVGNDQQAREFLGKLDSDPTVGSMVDCTSNYETESEEMLRANPPVELTPDLWIVKLLLGAIDPSYDTQDERGSAPPGQYGGGYPGQSGPPGNYGAPGQSGPGGYGAAPPQQYQQQQQYGQQQSQYGQQQPQYGQQQPQYGAQQQNYNRPPPQQPYGQSGQSGQSAPYPGYSAPPPPPRY